MTAVVGSSFMARQARETKECCKHIRVVSTRPSQDYRGRMTDSAPDKAVVCISPGQELAVCVIGMLVGH